MQRLETTVKSNDADLKRLGSQKESLAKAQEGLRKEINELLATLRRG